MLIKRAKQKAARFVPGFSFFPPGISHEARQFRGHRARAQRGWGELPRRRGTGVKAHGFLRFTRDVDIVVRLARADIFAAFRALEGIDYRPSVPITAEQFADAELRESWRREKGMLVLKMWSDRRQETPLDIFVYEPFDFDAEYAVALRGTEPDDPPASFVAIPALIRMKEEAGRESDLIDIKNLRLLLDLQRTEPPPLPPPAPAP